MTTTGPAVERTDHGWTSRLTMTAGGSLTIGLLTYGGHLVEVSMPDQHGRRANVVRSLARLEDYRSWGTNPCVGSLIGRHANRIADGRFELDGRRYRVPPNDGRHHLHGGAEGFHAVTWDLVQGGVVDGDAVVVLQHRSPDGHMGYPGTLTVTAAHRLSADDRLTLTLTASCDAPTPVNLSSHPYWNLDGGGDLAGHRLRVHASRWIPTDAEGIPTGEVAEVEGTARDLRDNPRLGPAHHDLDHCLLLDGAGRAGHALRPAAELTGRSGRRLRLATTQPGLQVFAAPLAGVRGPAHLCLEPEHPPDAVNQPHLAGDVILRPGEVRTIVIDHRFDVCPQGRADG